MAVGTLNVSGDLPLSILIKDATIGSVLNKTFGRVGVPDLNISLAFGTGAGQATQLYCAKRTLPALTYDLVDLSGSLGDGLGNTIALTSLKLALVAIVSPDGGATKKVRVGPQNKANAFLGPWGSATDANCFKEVTHWEPLIWEPVSGYPVANASTDIFPIYNPHATLPLDYWLLLAGK